jgi:hypothetical protein
MSNFELDPIEMGVEPVASTSTPFMRTRTYYGRKIIDRGTHSVNVSDTNHIIIVGEELVPTLEELEQSAARMVELYGTDVKEVKE